VSSDPVDDAIAATGAPRPVEMENRKVIIGSTGRPVLIAHPVDMTDAELFELVGWLVVALRGELAARRSSGPRLVLARPV
jgi:hypothetical protein